MKIHIREKSYRDTWELEDDELEGLLLYLEDNGGKTKSNKGSGGKN